MPRYIDADDVSRVLLNLRDRNIESDDMAFALDWAAQSISRLPTISPDEVRGVGEWIVKQTAIGKDYTVCSACETDFKFKTDKGTLARLDMRGMPYCPSCGARMTRAEAEKAMEVSG